MQLYSTGEILNFISYLQDHQIFNKNHSYHSENIEKKLARNEKKFNGIVTY